MGDIFLTNNPMTMSDYTVGNGDFGTKETGGEKDVNETETSRDWSTLLDGKSVTYSEQPKILAFALENPELEPSINITPQERNEAYDSILLKLKRAKGGKDGNQSVMFDIYSMMDIIQEMSQKLRNSLRELRKLENTTIYSNIRAQAEIQRESAIIGAVAGAVMCIIQVGVVVGGMVMQLKGGTTSSKTVGTGAMKSAVRQENMLNTFKNPSQNGMDALTKEVGAMQNAVNGGKAGPTMQGYYRDITNAASRESGSRISAAKTKVVGAQKKVDTCKGNYDKNPSAENKAALDKANQELGAAKTELKDAEISGVQVKEYKAEDLDANPNILARGKQLNDAALKNVASAKNDYLSAKNAYMRAKETDANGGPMTKGELKALRSKMETARSKYDLARGEQAQISSELRQNNMLAPEEIANTEKCMAADVEELREVSKFGNNPLQGAEGQRNAVAGIMVQQVGMAVGGFLQQLAGSIREIISSKGLELQAEQKLSEEQFDQIKDLFSLVQGVIQKSIDVFASVIQKESSVIEGILQHV